MRILFGRPRGRGSVLIALAMAMTAAAACSQSRSEGQPSELASDVTARWSKAFDAGDLAALAGLYADTARVLPPGAAPLVGRPEIEAYWRADIGEGGVTTKLTTTDALVAGDVLHVDGTYLVTGTEGTELAKGQYEQLWRRDGDDWQVLREMWRMDPALIRGTQVAGRLTSSWTQAYNAGDAKALAALYADEAAITTMQEGTFTGQTAIEQFWAADFGDTKPSSSLTLTDAYLSGELAHLEGEYTVAEKGAVTEGRYLQLWMRDGNAWRVHREMWLR
jgi:ketosteroid isomerase-like protein